QQAGKTALLANADINYILQKQHIDPLALAPSDHCDWWITQEASIIDVPSHYCTVQTKAKQVTAQAELYRYFLELSKQARGQGALQGIILALPLPEIMASSDQKAYTRLLHTVFQLLIESKKAFTERIPLMIIITKCDLLAGFNTFF